MNLRVVHRSSCHRWFRGFEAGEATQRELFDLADQPGSEPRECLIVQQRLEQRTLATHPPRWRTRTDREPSQNEASMELTFAYWLHASVVRTLEELE
jgi:hypothetical protein